MLRVLFITGEYPPMQGGVGDYTWTLGATLAGQGVDVHVLTSQHAGPSHLVPRGVSNVYPQLTSWGWGMQHQVADVVKEIQPDVVHIQYQAAAFDLHPATNLLPRFLKKRGRALRMAVTFHDLRVPYLFPKAGPLRWRTNLDLARQSDLVLVTNAEGSGRLQAYRELIGELREIPIGANIRPEPPADFERARQRARWDVGAEDLLLCYFGFLNASKGAEELALAVASLAAEKRAGASSDDRRANQRQRSYQHGLLQQVKALIESQGVVDRVHWTGFTEASQVSANFLASDIAVLPYRDDVSFRLGSLMAAIAHELPIISTEPAVQIPEVVHGENMWLTPVQAPAALGKAIIHLWNDPALRQRLSVGSALLTRLFTWDTIAQQHGQVYRELIEQPAD